MASLISAIQLIGFILTLIVVIDIVLRWFLNPYHPLRSALDSIVEPMLAPIRRVLPSVGMFDFSPIVLIILINLIESILIQVLVTIF